MIKRRFYKLEHRDRDSASSYSSSSSDGSDPEDERGEPEDDGPGAEGGEQEVAAEEKNEREKPASESLSSGSSSSGYESGDSSGNEINCDSTGLLANDYEEDSGKDGQSLEDSLAHESHPEGSKRFDSKNTTKTIGSEDSLQAEMVDCVLKCKSVFKCRICPRIVCLSEDTLLAHLRSKRHARSKKLLSEGRLKLMLNSNGEIEEEEETHAERHARTVALAQTPKRKNKGRQRQRQRQMRSRNGGYGGKTNPLQKKQMTKRHKIED